MTFKKNHKLGALPFNDEPFDTSPVCFKVRKGVKDKLKAVPDWQERLRAFVDNLIESAAE
ncbi:hypothetical protein H6G81_20160 [Scytonema hofmannii FACHB-248]|uniref:Uncharacterized protein n=1 Tax=Scytonema hofmannii FACHB-248 TaxID=1842502 RepID=A0ABR8GTF8_9CYAN|nr:MULTISPECIES: hypothetical protein [Nostocales]MBD2606782.1 hypothetical protein [Scytonema hofmannii FACHB-248]